MKDRIAARSSSVGGGSWATCSLTHARTCALYSSSVTLVPSTATKRLAGRACEVACVAQVGHQVGVANLETTYGPPARSKRVGGLYVCGRYTGLGPCPSQGLAYPPPMRSAFRFSPDWAMTVAR